MGCLKSVTLTPRAAFPAPPPCSQSFLAGPAHSSPSRWTHFILTLSPWQTLSSSLFCQWCKHCTHQTCFLFFPEKLVLPHFLPRLVCVCFLHDSSFILSTSLFLLKSSLSTSFGSSSPQKAPLLVLRLCPIRGNKPSAPMPQLVRSLGEQNCWNASRIWI